MRTDEYCDLVVHASGHKLFGANEAREPPYSPSLVYEFSLWHDNETYMNPSPIKQRGLCADEGELRF